MNKYERAVKIFRENAQEFDAGLTPPEPEITVTPFASIDSSVSTVVGLRDSVNSLIDALADAGVLDTSASASVGK